jgi:fumarylacetoacetate (FAA) hydrolase family protein
LFTRNRQRPRAPPRGVILRSELCGLVLHGASSLAQISRDPVDIVAQTINENHQYPDGLVLFLGTMFAPIQDRAVKGQGFTHVEGD